MSDLFWEHFNSPEAQFKNLYMGGEPTVQYEYRVVQQSPTRRVLAPTPGFPQMMDVAIAEAYRTVYIWQHPRLDDVVIERRVLRPDDEWEPVS